MFVREIKNKINLDVFSSDICRTRFAFWIFEFLVVSLSKFQFSSNFFDATAFAGWWPVGNIRRSWWLLRIATAIATAASGATGRFSDLFPPHHHPTPQDFVLWEGDIRLFSLIRACVL